MIHTIYNVLFPHRLHSLLHKRLVAVLNVSGEFLGPQYTKSSLYFAEYWLYWVVVGLVGYIVDVAEIQLLHRRFAFFGGVGRELVHE
jgi:hypothetical protein